MIAWIPKLLTCTVLTLTLAGCAGAVPTSVAPAGTGSPSLAGPGSPTPAGQPAGSIDSCALLSDQEIEAATEQGVSERKPSTLTRVFPSVCDIELDGGGALTVSIMASGGRSMYETSFEPFIGEGETPYLDRAIEGLGDKAGISGDDDLLVLKDDVLFDLFIYANFGRSDKEAVLRYLAEVILAKLPCLAVGCPGFTPPLAPSTAQAIDACSLLTEPEVESATGFEVLDSEPFVGTGGDDVCSWTLDTEPISSTIELSIREPGGRAQFDFWANAFETPLEHLPGLGDDAMKTGTEPAGSVYAVVGDRLITLRFTFWGSVDDPYALVIPLVGPALSRLQ